MYRPELKKILFEKKKLYLEKERTLNDSIKKNENEFYNEYVQMLKEDFERFKLDIFEKFCDSYYFNDSDEFKIKYVCLYTCKYKQNNLPVYEIHDIKNNTKFLISDEDIDTLNHESDTIYSNMKCKFSKKNCIKNARKSYAVPIKFSITREDFNKMVYDVINDSPKKVKKL